MSAKDDTQIDELEEKVRSNFVFCREQREHDLKEPLHGES